jgi:hypothetical protein
MKQGEINMDRVRWIARQMKESIESVDALDILYSFSGGFDTEDFVIVAGLLSEIASIRASVRELEKLLPTEN